MILLGLTDPLFVDAASPAEIYQTRILPILRSNQASSCTECHWQGIDLKNVLLEDPSQTFAELRAREWIDVDSPEKSKILEFIAKQPDDSNDLQRKVRDAELGAMCAWIEASVKEPALLALPIAKLKDLELDRELLLHARRDRITNRFVSTIWSQLERCANCHSPDRNQKHRDKHGEIMSWIVPNSPAATLRLLEERHLIDLENPETSLVRSKAMGEVEHGGGTKFPKGGKIDQAWTAFIVDYASVRRSKYSSATEISEQPELRSWMSGLHLRIINMPRAWSDRMLQVTLHRKQAKGAYASKPSAWAESRVSSERLSWSNTLSLLVESLPSRSDAVWPIEISESLPEGRYQARLELMESDDGTVRNTDRDATTHRLLGVFEVDVPWPSGHSSAKEVPFSAIELDHAFPPK